MRRIVVMVMVVSLALASVGFAAELWDNPYESPEDVALPKYVPNKIVVRFDPQTVGAMNRETARHGRLGIPALDRLGAQLGAASIAPQFPGAKKKMVRGKVFDLSGWHIVKFAAKVDVQAAVAAYKALPGVINAHPVSFLKAYREPAEQFLNYQWYLDQIDAYRAWDIQTGSPDIVIAVLDSGVRYFAADMGGGPPNGPPPDEINPLYDAEPYNVPLWSQINGNMWINEAERSGTPGVDDNVPPNGYQDDWIGWDFVDGNTSGLPGLAGEDYTTPDNDPRDFNGHGTQCASIAGAITNNNEAGAGVAGGWWPTPGVKIMPLRIAYSVGYLGLLEIAVGDTALAASALYYAANNGARIASFSYGASVNDGTMDAALNYFLNNVDGLNGEGLFFAAAGNSASNQAPYPQSYPHPNVIVVGGTDDYDTPWIDLFGGGGTNYGDWVDISAPCVDICTLTHLNADPDTDYFLDPYFSAVTGTSFACPMVAGVAALMWSQNPQLSATQVKDLLLDPANCDPIYGNFSGIPPSQLGAGRVNAYKAVRAVASMANQPPVAVISAEPTSGDAPLPVQFDGSGSYDPDGTSLSYAWDFGDGGTSSAVSPSHTYASAGTFVAILTVTDNLGATNSSSVSIQVNAGNQLPVPVISAEPTSGDAPLTVQFDGSRSYDPDGTIVSYAWNFGDGGSSSAASPSHTYSSAGTYTATLTVTDNDGAPVADSVNISVTQPQTDTMHIGDLDGKPVVKRNNWHAEVTALVHGPGESKVMGATVTGEWSGGASGTSTAITNKKGVAKFKSPTMKSETSVTFTVTSVTYGSLTYNGANHDPDGDSDGTSITVPKPSTAKTK